MIYLNYAALSPTRVEVEQEVTATLNAFKPFLYSDAGIQWYLTKAMTCRQAVAQLLQVEDPATIAFVPNASTANHLILSMMEWQPNEVLCTSSHENPSILRELRRLASKGVEIQAIVPTTPPAFIDHLKRALSTGRVKAVLLSHVSHVDGRIFPIETISALARAHKIPLIVDGAQAVGHIPVDVQQLNGAVYFFTGHKWCEGPLGTGAVVIPDQFLELNPPFACWAKDHDKPPATLFEIGTHNIGLIAGLAKACTLKKSEGLHQDRLEGYRRDAKIRLKKCKGIQFMEWDGPHAPGILTLKGVPGTDLMKLAKFWADEHELIVKMFSDYPEGETPAIRLSWSATASKQTVQKALDMISGSLGHTLKRLPV